MARGYNKAIIMGNLARDPEVRSLQGGSEVCNFTLACNRTWKDKNGQKQEDCDFINVTVWGVMGSNCGKYLSKGSSCLVEGRISVTSYEKDGERKWTTKVIASSVQFLNSKKDSDNANSNSNYDNPNGKSGNFNKAEAPVDISGMPSSEDDDLPDLPF